MVSGSAAQEEAQPTTIQLGEYFYGTPVNAAPVGDASKPEKIVATITGAAKGEIVLVLKNVGKLEHEVQSALFLDTTETQVKSFDASGKEISKVETVGALREVEVQPGTTAEVTLSLDETLQRAFEDDPSLEMRFELACQSGHDKRDTAKDHYQMGMRGWIVLKP
ncbi:hypothetical protein HY230_11630 [Candidatus Acetothermia bacterium]|nr:hypothetical protein [Candidatus Acetothermia bacterium]